MIAHSIQGRAGVTALRDAIDEWSIDSRPADSVLEPAMRKLVQRHGLPDIEFHPTIEGREVDFRFTGTPVIVECDGWAYHGLQTRAVRAGSDAGRHVDCCWMDHPSLHVPIDHWTAGVRGSADASRTRPVGSRRPTRRRLIPPASSDLGRIRVADRTESDRDRWTVRSRSKGGRTSGAFSRRGRPAASLRAPRPPGPSGRGNRPSVGATASPATAGSRPAARAGVRRSARPRHRGADGRGGLRRAGHGRRRARSASRRTAARRAATRESTAPTSAGVPPERIEVEHVDQHPGRRVVDLFDDRDGVGERPHRHDRQELEHDAHVGARSLDRRTAPASPRLATGRGRGWPRARCAHRWRCRRRRGERRRRSSAGRRARG